MEILLPDDVCERLKLALRKAGRREIGGLLVAEHLGDDCFRIKDISIQTGGGNVSSFCRDPAQHVEFLDVFFARTGHEYRKYNYFGEWHSHPCFEPIPSQTDVKTMYSIVDDPAVGVNFAVLLITRLDSSRNLQFSSTVFTRAHLSSSATVRVETQSSVKTQIGGRWTRFFNLRRS